MPAFPFYSFDSPQYAADFQTLLRCVPHRQRLDAVLAEALAPYDRGAVAVDWGAGSGALTRHLLDRFDRVYAVEPSEPQRQLLARNCPAARVVAGTLHTPLPESVDVGVIRHVLYHVPDHLWGPYVVQAADRLSPRGLLVVTLKHPDSACNAMLEAFGAPAFNLFVLNDTLRRCPELRVEWVATPGPVATSTFEETYAIARFILSDRPVDAYARPFTTEQVEAYVRRHLWDEAAGRGGWRCDSLSCLIRRNAHWQ
jgi:SAM-dependent methyltransferase